MTDYLRPESLDEALRARRAHPEFVILAGGTDLLVGAIHKDEPPGVIDLFGLEPLCGVGLADDGGLRIGAATTYAALIAEPIIQRELPLLCAAAREIGALQIQARGTVGGNLATSSPVGDSLPVWLALDAAIELASESGRRTVPYREFCTGYRTTAMKPDELIVAVHVPPRPPGLVQHWRKVGPRRAQSISKVMLAATAVVDGGRINHARVALGAVADRPIRATRVEAALNGHQPGPDLAARAAEILATEITPIDDVRSTAAYRLRVAGNLVARFVTTLSG